MIYLIILAISLFFAMTANIICNHAAKNPELDKRIGTLQIRFGWMGAFVFLTYVSAAANYYANIFDNTFLIALVISTLILAALTSIPLAKLITAEEKHAKIDKIIKKTNIARLIMVFIMLALTLLMFGMNIGGIR